LLLLLLLLAVVCLLLVLITDRLAVELKVIIMTGRLLLIVLLMKQTRNCQCVIAPAETIEEQRILGALTQPLAAGVRLCSFKTFAMASTCCFFRVSTLNVGSLIGAVTSKLIPMM
jgi:hypothetical protein